jgi:nitrogen fixation NifU-like protein
MYSEKLLDHFQHPRNSGELPAPAVHVRVENPVCGDILELWGRFEGRMLAEVRYRARGCTASIAAGSALTGLLTGRSAGEGVSAGEVEEALGGLRPESRHAAVLAAEGARALLGTV